MVAAVVADVDAVVAADAAVDADAVGDKTWNWQWLQEVVLLTFVSVAGRLLDSAGVAVGPLEVLSANVNGVIGA